MPPKRTVATVALFAVFAVPGVLRWLLSDDTSRAGEGYFWPVMVCLIVWAGLDFAKTLGRKFAEGMQEQKEQAWRSANDIAPSAGMTMLARTKDRERQRAEGTWTEAKQRRFDADFRAWTNSE